MSLNPPRKHERVRKDGAPCCRSTSRGLELVQMLRSFGRASNSSERTALTPQNRKEPQNHRCRFCVALIERSLNATRLDASVASMNYEVKGTKSNRGARAALPFADERIGTVASSGQPLCQCSEPIFEFGGANNQTTRYRRNSRQEHCSTQSH